MDKQQWKKISHIFDLALTLSAEHRTTYIKKLCADDTELQDEINALLASVEESDKMLEDHLQKNEALLSDFNRILEGDTFFRSLEGSVIGSWRVVELLGRGGMGAVYKVERTESDIHQQGALKIMRRGLDTPENIRRFRLEKQILAGLNHPNIARLIEGGVSEDGRPYLVMEFVEGRPIPEYCDNHHLTLEERLALFKDVCKAVQYAHKNLIVHRDLKPDNILVTQEGHVKILDFGIAKLLDPDLYEFSTVETRQGMRPMSLEYAAPEQVSEGTITTATDVYSLGILLYELLSGTKPLDFTDEKFHSITRKIREEQPDSPSRKLRHFGDTKLLSEVAASRSVEPDELIKKLQGDLDAIILKALRKEAEVRYESVSQLVEDLKLYQQNKIVGVRSDSVQYRISKFIQRHKKGLAIAATSLILIISLVAFYTFCLAEERNTAQLEAQKTEQVKDLLVEIFQSGDPFLEPDARNITVQQVLDEGTKRISSGLEAQPLVQAELQEALGNVYSGLIMYSRAEPLLREALTTYKEELGDDHTDVARVSHLLGFLLFRKGKYEEAEKLYETAKKIYKNKYGEDDPYYAYSAGMMANLYSETGQSEQALDLYNRAIAIYEKNNSANIARTLQDLGYLLMGMGRFGEAQESLERAIRLFKKYDEEPDAAVANALTGLGQTMQLQGNLTSAENYHRKALEIRQEIFEAGHTHIASSHLRLGWVLVEQGRIPEAIPMVQKAYHSFKSHLPAAHWKIAASEGVLALAWIGQGKFKQAEQTLLNTHKVFQEQFGRSDWRTQSARQTLAKLYTAWDKPQKIASYSGK